jgi:GR25 family glycosyltransferase involved in LPS biosynthesis
LNQFAWSGYDLGYHKESIYHGAMMTPGTSAYILTPRGAKKLLSAAEKHGLDQSDFIINNDVLNMEYIYPSPVKFQKVNPNLSHRL